MNTDTDSRDVAEEDLVKVEGASVSRLGSITTAPSWATWTLNKSSTDVGNIPGYGAFTPQGSVADDNVPGCGLAQISSDYNSLEDAGDISDYDGGTSALVSSDYWIYVEFTGGNYLRVHVTNINTGENGYFDYENSGYPVSTGIGADAQILQVEQGIYIWDGLGNFSNNYGFFLIPKIHYRKSINDTSHSFHLGASASSPDAPFWHTIFGYHGHSTGDINSTNYGKYSYAAIPPGLGVVNFGDSYQDMMVTAAPTDQHGADMPINMAVFNAKIANSDTYAGGGSTVDIYGTNFSPGNWWGLNGHNNEDTNQFWGCYLDFHESGDGQWMTPDFGTQFRFYISNVYYDGTESNLTPMGCFATSHLKASDTVTNNWHEYLMLEDQTLCFDPAATDSPTCTSSDITAFNETTREVTLADPIPGLESSSDDDTDWQQGDMVIWQGGGGTNPESYYTIESFPDPAGNDYKVLKLKAGQTFAAGHTGRMARVGRNCGLSIQPIFRLSVSNAAKYTWGHYNISSNEESYANFLVKGARIYWASNVDGFNTKNLLYDADWEKGIKAYGLRGDISGGAGYAKWTRHLAQDDGTPSTAIYSSSLGETVFETPPTLETYEGINLYPDGDRLGPHFKTACMSGNTVYIGNIKYFNYSTGLTSPEQAYPDRMLSSAPGKHFAFPEGNYVDAVINDGEAIVHLAAYADRILQFKEKTLYIINVSSLPEILEDKFDFRGVERSCHVTKTSSGIAFLNRSGCYLYDGSTIIDLLYRDSIRLISMKTWREFVGPESYKRVFSIGYDQMRNRLVLVAGIGGYDLKNAATEASGGDRYPADEGIQMLMYDMSLQAWSSQDFDVGNIKHYDRAGPNSTAEFLLSNFAYSPKGELVVYQHQAHESTTGGQHVEATPSTLLSVNNTAGHYDMRREMESGPVKRFNIITRDIDFGEPGVRKKIYRVYVTYKSHGPSNVKVTYDKNGDGLFTGEFVSDSDYWAALDNTRLYNGCLTASGILTKALDPNWGNHPNFWYITLGQINGELTNYIENNPVNVRVTFHGDEGTYPSQHFIQAGTCVTQARPPYPDTGYWKGDNTHSHGTDSCGPEVLRAVESTPVEAGGGAYGELTFYRGQFGTALGYWDYMEQGGIGPGTVLVCGQDDNIISATAVLKPKDSSDIKDVKSFALQFKNDGSSQLSASTPQTFEISDITIIYRMKSTK